MRQSGHGVSFLVPSVPFGDVLEQMAITTRCDAHYGDVQEAISSRMRLLQSFTRDLPAGYMRLQLQRRLSTQQGESLRWVQGLRMRVVPDVRVPAIIASYQGRWREWFVSVHAEMRWLNAQERMCRAARKEFSQLSAFLAAASSRSSQINPSMQGDYNVLPE